MGVGTTGLLGIVDTRIYSVARVAEWSKSFSDWMGPWRVRRSDDEKNLVSVFLLFLSSTLSQRIGLKMGGL